MKQNFYSFSSLSNRSIEILKPDRIAKIIIIMPSYKRRAMTFVQEYISQTTTVRNFISDINTD